jgi:hypothetical protein
MNSNRALMRYEMDKHQQEILKIKTRVKLVLNDLAVLLNPSLREFGEMDIASAARHMDDLVMLQGELLGHKAKIGQLEEMLYG